MEFFVTLLLLGVSFGVGASKAPSSANCSELFFEQNIDHFNWAPTGGQTPGSTFQQRYFVCDQHWHHKAVFFYFGNEDDVTLYVNHTGLMWENAAQFGAMLIFAEHRYVHPFYPRAFGIQFIKIHMFF